MSGKEAPMRVWVDESECIGSGLCEDACPRVFEVEDGVSRVLVEPVPPDAEDDARVAVETCPVSAIRFEE
jgi:ferredoxin